MGIPPILAAVYGDRVLPLRAAILRLAGASPEAARLETALSSLEGKAESALQTTLCVLNGDSLALRPGFSLRQLSSQGEVGGSCPPPASAAAAPRPTHQRLLAPSLTAAAQPPHLSPSDDTVVLWPCCCCCCCCARDMGGNTSLPQSAAAAQLVNRPPPPPPPLLAAAAAAPASSSAGPWTPSCGPEAAGAAMCCRWGTNRCAS